MEFSVPCFLASSLACSWNLTRAKALLPAMFGGSNLYDDDGFLEEMQLRFDLSDHKPVSKSRRHASLTLYERMSPQDQLPITIEVMPRG